MSTIRKRECITSIVCLVLAGVLYFYAGTYPKKAEVTPVINPGFYPQLLALLLAGLSIALFIQALIQGKKQVEEEPEEPVWGTKKGLFLFLFTIGILILYPFLLEFLGFAVANFIFIFFLIIALTEQAKQKILPILALTLILTGVMYLVFTVVLSIPFPRGIFK